MKELRDYQKRAVDEVRAAISSGSKSVVMVMPTGAGKSLTYAEIIRLASGKGKKCLFLVHRRNLVTQMVETLVGHGVTDVGVIMAGTQANTAAQVQVATIQTFSRRLNLEELKINRFFFPADVVLVDETHTAVSKRYKAILGLYADKIIIGCTATPMRADGRGLGEVFDSLVDVVGVKELTERGFLAPARYFVPPSQPDLSGVKMARGDYEIGELGKRMSDKKLIGDIVDNWLRIAPGRKTIVFCVNVKHAVAVSEQFRRVGVSAAILSAKSSDEEREQAFKDMDNGRLQVICNVALYIEGMDCPDISCVVMARPTKSIGLYRQACGRGLRPSGIETIIIDHGGVIEEHGLLDDEIEWSLDGKEKAWRKKKQEKKPKQPCKCSVCDLVFSGGSVCPDCGSPIKSFGKPVEVIDAELEELGGKKKATMAEKRRWYGMLLHIRNERGYRSGWEANQYRERFKVWPRGMEFVMPIKPDEEVTRWIKHRQIKYAKSIEKRREAGA